MADHVDVSISAVKITIQNPQTHYGVIQDSVCGTGFKHIAEDHSTAQLSSRRQAAKLSMAVLLVAMRVMYAPADMTVMILRASLGR